MAMNIVIRGGLPAFRESAGTQRVMTTAISKETAGRQMKTKGRIIFQVRKESTEKKTGQGPVVVLISPPARW
jgi:hypothetical protein